MSISKDQEVRLLVEKWLSKGGGLSIQERLEAIKTALYMYRNNLTKDGEIPPELVSSDEEVVAALEHYFYARSEVASANYSAMNMKAMIHGYQLAKKIGFDLRHNKNNPTTKPSELQQKWALLGVDKGAQDLATINMQNKRSGKSSMEAPMFRMPPNFNDAYGKAQISKLKY